MAKKASTKGTGGGAKKKPARKAGSSAKSPTAKAPAKAKSESGSKRSRSQGPRTDRPQSEGNAADAFFKLLESPLVVDLIAVAATAALAAIAEQRFSRRDGAGKGASRAAKAAGKAAAAAVGRRVAEEWDEIRKASEARARGEA